MLDALSMATLMRRNRWMRTETASARSSEALGGPEAIGRVVDVRRCAGAQAVMTGSVRKWPVMRPAPCGVWDRCKSSPVRGLKLDTIVLIRAMRIHVAMATSLFLCRRKVTLDVSILSFRLINLSAAGWRKARKREDINCRNAQTTPADSRAK